jgi:hypothetical protein
MFLHDEDVAAWLQALTDKEFIEFFCKYLAARKIVSEDAPGIQNHLALAEVRQLPDGRGRLRPPVAELLCTSPIPSGDNAPIKSRGTCCGFQTGSLERYAACPVEGIPHDRQPTLSSRRGFRARSTPRNRLRLSRRCCAYHDRECALPSLAIFWRLCGHVSVSLRCGQHRAL